MTYDQFHEVILYTMRLGTDLCCVEAMELHVCMKQLF